MKFFKKILGWFLGKKIGQGLFRFLHFVALKGMNFGGGVTPKDSGEDYVVSYALKKLKGNRLTVFDVGANKGEYTSLWLTKSTGENIIIHSFEPAKSLAESLKQKFQGKPVSIHHMALSGKSGEVTLFSNHEGSGLASLIKRDLAFAGMDMKAQETVLAKTLDEFCSTQKIENIDFLKLDVEGMEISVLSGAENLLRQKKIKFIQFEFGGADIDAKIFFKDFYNLLSPNYHLYRILKNGLYPIKKYSELDEIFVTTNYLAEQKD
jgi:FkbM family methyltransferase